MGDKEEEMGTVINSKLFILHGWARNIEKWMPFLKLLEQDGVEYMVLKIPGLTAHLSSAWTLDNYVSWLRQQVISYKLPVVLLGHSNGGRIAASFAAKYPSKISHLILIDSAGIIHKDFLTSFKKNIFQTLAKGGKRITNSSSFKNLIYKLAGEQDYKNADENLKKTMLNLISKDLEPIFSEISIPTLIIWGNNDRITPVSDGRKIHELVPGSKFEVIKNARHSPQFTHPKEVARIIIQQLNNKTIEQ